MGNWCLVSMRELVVRCAHRLFLLFLQEGVGDTPDSYAYDGNRVRKWNVTTTNYGKVRMLLYVPGRLFDSGSSPAAVLINADQYFSLAVMGGRRHCQLYDRLGWWHHNILSVSDIFGGGYFISETSFSSPFSLNSFCLFLSLVVFLSLSEMASPWAQPSVTLRWVRALHTFLPSVFPSKSQWLSILGAAPSDILTNVFEFLPKQVYVWLREKCTVVEDYGMG